MEARELRVGNYVDTPKDGQNPFRIDIIEVYQTGFFKVGMVYDANVHPLTWYSTSISPIQLTEDWLVRFGFVEIDNHYTLFLDDKKCDLTSKRLTYWKHQPNYTPSELELSRSGISFKSIFNPTVHQLQNLYFALTGEELTLKTAI